MEQKWNLRSARCEIKPTLRKEMKASVLKSPGLSESQGGGTRLYPQTPERLNIHNFECPGKTATFTRKNRTKGKRSLQLILKVTPWYLYQLSNWEVNSVSTNSRSFFFLSPQ
jgi:hypothetical protein